MLEEEVYGANSPIWDPEFKHTPTGAASQSPGANNGNSICCIHKDHQSDTTGKCVKYVLIL